MKKSINELTDAEIANLLRETFGAGSNDALFYWNEDDPVYGPCEDFLVDGHFNVKKIVDAFRSLTKNTA